MPLPPDPEQQNGDRADWADAAIDAFVETTQTESEDALADLLCNLRHWIDRHPRYGTWESNLYRAMNNYQEETTPYETN
jgi:hypothetical protein